LFHGSARFEELPTGVSSTHGTRWARPERARVTKWYRIQALKDRASKVDRWNVSHRSCKHVARPACEIPGYLFPVLIPFKTTKPASQDSSFCHKPPGAAVILTDPRREAA